MKFILFASICKIICGLAELLGICIIPSEYRGRNWTKNYIRLQGKSNLLCGIPWLIFYLLYTYYLSNMCVHYGILFLIFLVLSLPSLIYTFVTEFKFKELLEKETDQN